jgi:hypothetical protein
MHIGYLNERKMAVFFSFTASLLCALELCKGALFECDCDDDGEEKAGSRLAHLLYVLKAENVLVVVSRWYFFYMPFKVSLFNYY